MLRMSKSCGKSPYVGITFLVSIQASGFLQQKHPKCWDSITSITSSYVGITVSSLFLGIKIFQKKSRKYLVHIQASCKINYSYVTLLKKDSRKENYKHQFCRFRHKKTTQYRSGIFANSYKIPSKKPNSQCPSGRSRGTI